MGKERGLSSVLNAVLNDPSIREKFSVNLKETSWNNYRYSYSLEHEGGVEVDTSVLFTSKTFIPRSIRINATIHVFGMSVNVMDATLRLEGLDELLKAILVDKLSSEQLLKRILDQPEKLADLLKIVADKVCRKIV